MMDKGVGGQVQLSRAEKGAGGGMLVSVVVVARGGLGRGLGPGQGRKRLPDLSSWHHWALLCPGLASPSMPFVTRPQPEPGVAMATSEEPISLVMPVVRSLAWSVVLPAGGLLGCPQFLCRPWAVAPGLTALPTRGLAEALPLGHCGLPLVPFSGSEVGLQCRQLAQVG